MSGDRPAALQRHCSCGAHGQHEVFRILWHNPELNLKQVAKLLGISYANAKQRASRMRKKDVEKRCPECFGSSFFGLICQHCGFDATERNAQKGSIDFAAQSPIYRLQPNGSLGSATPYGELHLAYGARNILHLVERPDDARFEKLRSRLWQGLKSTMPRDDVCEDAVKMLRAEYIDAQLRYPGVGSWRGFPDAVLLRVWARLRLLYPQIPREPPVALKSRKGGDRVTCKVDPLSSLFDGEGT